MSSWQAFGRARQARVEAVNTEEGRRYRREPSRPRDEHSRFRDDPSSVRDADHEETRRDMDRKLICMRTVLFLDGLFRPEGGGAPASVLKNFASRWAEFSPFMLGGVIVERTVQDTRLLSLNFGGNLVSLNRFRLQMATYLSKHPASGLSLRFDAAYDDCCWSAKFPAEFGAVTSRSSSLIKDVLGRRYAVDARDMAREDTIGYRMVADNDDEWESLGRELFPSGPRSPSPPARMSTPLTRNDDRTSVPYSSPVSTRSRAKKRAGEVDGKIKSIDGTDNDRSAEGERSAHKKDHAAEKSHSSTVTAKKPRVSAAHKTTQEVTDKDAPAVKDSREVDVETPVTGFNITNMQHLGGCPLKSLGFVRLRDKCDCGARMVEFSGDEESINLYRQLKTSQGK